MSDEEEEEYGDESGAGGEEQKQPPPRQEEQEQGPDFRTFVKQMAGMTDIDINSSQEDNTKAILAIRQLIAIYEDEKRHDHAALAAFKKELETLSQIALVAKERPRFVHLMGNMSHQLIEAVTQLHAAGGDPRPKSRVGAVVRKGRGIPTGPQKKGAYAKVGFPERVLSRYPGTDKESPGTMKDLLQAGEWIRNLAAGMPSAKMPTSKRAQYLAMMAFEASKNVKPNRFYDELQSALQTAGADIFKRQAVYDVFRRYYAQGGGRPAQRAPKPNYMREHEDEEEESEEDKAQRAVQQARAQQVRTFAEYAHPGIPFHELRHRAGYKRWAKWIANEFLDLSPQQFQMEDIDEFIAKSVFPKLAQWKLLPSQLVITHGDKKFNKLKFRGWTSELVSPFKGGWKLVTHNPVIQELCNRMQGANDAFKAWVQGKQQASLPAEVGQQEEKKAEPPQQPQTQYTGEQQAKFLKNAMKYVRNNSQGDRVEKPHRGEIGKFFREEDLRNAIQSYLAAVNSGPEGEADWKAAVKAAKSLADYANVYKYDGPPPPKPPDQQPDYQPPDMGAPPPVQQPPPVQVQPPPPPDEKAEEKEPPGEFVPAQPPPQPQPQQQAAAQERETEAWRVWVQRMRNRVTAEPDNPRYQAVWRTIQRDFHKHFWQYNPIDNRIRQRFRNHQLINRHHVDDARNNRGKRTEVHRVQRDPAQETVHEKLTKLSLRHDPLANTPGDFGSLGSYINVRVNPSAIHICIKKNVQEAALRRLSQRLVEHVKGGSSRIMLRRTQRGKHVHSEWISPKSLSSMTSDQLYKRLLQVTKNRKRYAFLILRQEHLGGSIHDLVKISESLI